MISDGFLGLTDLNLLGLERPQECQDFFDREGLTVTSIETALDTIGKAGFEPLGHFVLPRSSWWTDYYLPLGMRLVNMKEDHADDLDLMNLITDIEREIELYRHYAHIYGYVFYVMRA